MQWEDVRRLWGTCSIDRVSTAPSAGALLFHRQDLLIRGSVRRQLSSTPFLWAWQPRLLNSITFHKLCLWGVA